MEPLTQRRIFSSWWPMAATWMMMSTEGPFLAAVIARLADPKYNLAAYGVAFSFALIMEAPIIMMMSASTALVRNRDAYTRLRNFTIALNAAITGAMLLFLTPAVFDFVAVRLIDLPPRVAEITRSATAMLLPWPAAIGFRRFYQGLLIRGNATRRVAYGTVIRLASMGGTAIACTALTDAPGAVVGAVALSAGVTLEAVMSRIMAHRAVAAIRALPPDPGEAELTYRGIAAFYAPLALTSLLALGVQPMITFFVGRSRMPLESLAVMPVVNSLVFVFRSIGLSFQEVTIANLGDRLENHLPLRRFGTMLGIAAMAGLAVIALTPAAGWWFRSVSGLPADLAAFALLPLQLQILIPPTSVLIAFQHATLVHARRTAPITWGTAVEVGLIVAVMFAATDALGIVGAVAASIALVAGRAGANACLMSPFRDVVRAAAAASVKRNTATGPAA